MKLLPRLFWIYFVLCTNIWASQPISSWYTLSADHQVTLNVEVFLSSTCPHCRKADEFFNEIAAKFPDLHVQRNIINQDKNALLRFNQLLSEQNNNDFAVPSIYFCNSRWLGFASAETTGKDLLQAMNYCKEQIKKKGKLTSGAIETLSHWANANKFDSGMIENPSVLRYIVTIALTDAFAPCAFFCFAGFLAFLFIEKDKKKQFIASLLFIFSVALTHYFQQVHISSFYALLPWVRAPAIFLGTLIVYFVVQYYKKRSSNSLYFSLAFLLGLMITVYQQTCAMNWSYVFEQWLHNQGVSTLKASAYQLLYQIVYLVPLFITYVIYFTVLKIKRFAARHSQLTNIGLLLLLGIAVCLIVYPMLLSYLGVSLLIIILLFLLGSFLNLT